jgi:hypothetical protein
MDVNILKQMTKNSKLISQVLHYLLEQGWSELIDARWEEDVRKEITDKFTDIDEDTLNYIIKLVLY